MVQTNRETIMRLIIAIVAVIWTAVNVLAQTANQDFDHLHDSGHVAYQEGRWVDAARLYAHALTCPVDDSFRPAVLYNIACCWSLAGQADSAFAYLYQSLRAGYDNPEWLQADTDFDYLRREHPGRFADLFAAAPEIIREVSVNRSPIAVLGYQTYTGGTDLSRYRWDDYDDPSFDTLRNEYKLATIAGDDPSEFVRMQRLLDWASTRWQHSGSNECPDANALKLLRQAEQGERFRCVEFAVLLANCYSALGLPARVVGLAQYPVAYGFGRGHVVTEVWSNEFQKWIVLDPQNNAWWTDGTSIPLSADECRRLFVGGQGDHLNMVGQHSDWDYARQSRAWAPYFHHLDYNTHEIYFGKRSQSLSFEYLVDGVTPELHFQGFARNLHYTSDHHLAYPMLNQTSVSLTHAAVPGDSLTVRLTHTMPFFERYEVRLDENQWESSPASFSWRLNPGVNMLEARAVSKAGIVGKASRIVLQSNLSRSEDQP
jgi:hypothetical protein